MLDSNGRALVPLLLMAQPLPTGLPVAEEHQSAACLSDFIKPETEKKILRTDFGGTADG